MSKDIACVSCVFSVSGSTTIEYLGSVPLVSTMEQYHREVSFISTLEQYQISYFKHWHTEYNTVRLLCGKPGIYSDCPCGIRAEDVRTHVRAIFLRIGAKFVLLNAKQEKQTIFFYDFGTI